MFACGTGIREIFAYGNRNSTGFWNPESQNPESRIQNPESRIQNPTFTDKYLKSGIHSVESRIQDCPGLPYMGRQGSQWNPLVREAGDIVKSAIIDLTVTFIEGRKFSIAFLK